jgi:glycosyltransferase involved in cell wall biosynthesis
MVDAESGGGGRSFREDQGIPMMTAPFEPGLVSVIIPVYNRASLVERTIDSALNQTYANVEIVVIDDGSTDETPLVLARYAELYPSQVRVIRQANAGQVVARNKGIAVARGEYMAFLDSDDTWHPTKLARQLPLFKNGVGLVYSSIFEVDDDDRVLRAVPCEPNMRGYIYESLLVRNRMTGGSVVVTREALGQTGVFDTQLRAAENWDLWIRIAEKFAVDYVDEPLINYRVHDSNMSRDESRMREATSALLRKHFASPPSPDTPRHAAYLEAYANFYYRWGADMFASGDYSECRKKLRKCWEYAPGYRDSRIRYARTYLGRIGNGLLARVRALASSSEMPRLL